MKTFDEMFKELQPTDKYLIYIDGDEIKMDLESGKCGICHNQTRFYSINFMHRYCSITCINKEWDNYNEFRNKREIT